MRPPAEPDGRMGVSGFREDHDRPTVNPGRLILGTFRPARAWFTPTLVRFEHAALNLALAPRIRPAIESGDRRGFSRFRECPNQHAVSPGRLILGL